MKKTGCLFLFSSFSPVTIGQTFKNHLMKFFLILLSFAVQQTLVNAQTNNQPVTDTAIYMVVEESAKFPGGDEAMKKYLATHLHYPDVESKIAGSVYITFVVEKDGSLTNLKVIRDIPQCNSCNEEVLNVIRSMPKWVPGKHRGEEKRTQCIIPVKFSTTTQVPMEQSTPVNNDTGKLVLAVDGPMPSFQGGEGKMEKFIKKNIHYPPAAYKEGRAGICYITFFVEKDGRLSDIHIVRGASGGVDLDEEALRLVRSMPKWIPAKQDGHSIRAAYNLPIRFLR
jgi:TonB family protein